MPGLFREYGKMVYLPLANILQHKLRSALSVFGIAIGICMLVTLSGLSRGSFNEVADRWESVDADLIVYPRGLGDGAITSSGAILSDRYAGMIRAEHAKIVQRVVPVFLYPVRLGGQDQLASGVDPADFDALTAGGRLAEGRLFDPHGKFAAWLENELSKDSGKIFDPSQEQLAKPGRSGLELVIDSRLARAGKYRLNDTVTVAGHKWKIVGIVPTGAMSRVFLPRRAAQFLFDDGNIARSTLLFVKLRDGVAPSDAAADIKATIRQEVVPLEHYRQMLMSKIGVMFTYVDIVNAIALVIAFLFIMTTLYMTVLQRTREIAILRSCGASNEFILRQVLQESAILAALGAAGGVGMSFAATWAIETFKPLLTVTITWEWIAIALGAAATGSILSGLYPAWRATRVDMAEALSLE